MIIARWMTMPPYGLLASDTGGCSHVQEILDIVDRFLRLLPGFFIR
jgi:hypothetical protein